LKKRPKCFLGKKRPAKKRVLGISEYMTTHVYRVHINYTCIHAHTVVGRKTKRLSIFFCVKQRTSSLLDLSHMYAANKTLSTKTIYQLG
jgi:hypothetical protein